ncbi:MAG: hypothetical protein IPN25_06990 [Sphingobacteriales bacterium]|nr:hypothetical protein [Sphingobacteriales bacterium]
MLYGGLALIGFNYCFLEGFGLKLQGQNLSLQAIDDTVYITTPPLSFIPITLTGNDLIPNKTKTGVNLTTPPLFGTAAYDFLSGDVHYYCNYQYSTYTDYFEYELTDLETFEKSIATVVIIYTCLDCVWPGDANNDGTANVWDVLAIGLHYNETTTPTNTYNYNWVPVNMPVWGKECVNCKLDFKYVDCNGDGTIDLNDVATIAYNYGKQHFKGNKSTSEQAGIPLQLAINADTLIAKQTVKAEILLGTINQPALDVYGIALQIAYPKNLIKPKSFELNYTDSWLSADTANLLNLMHNDNDGYLDIALVRPTKTNISSNGRIATLNFIMEDVIIGSGKQTTENIPFELIIEKVTLLNAQSDTIATQIINGLAIALSAPILPPNNNNLNFTITPTLANTNITIKATNTAVINNIKQIQLLNSGGQIVWQIQQPDLKFDLTDFTISTTSFLSGMYYLHIKTNSGYQVCPVVILHP